MVGSHEDMLFIQTMNVSVKIRIQLVCSRAGEAVECCCYWWSRPGTDWQKETLPPGKDSSRQSFGSPVLTRTNEVVRFLLFWLFQLTA